MEITSRMPSGARHSFTSKKSTEGAAAQKEKKARWECWHCATPLAQRQFASLFTPALLWWPWETQTHLSSAFSHHIPAYRNRYGRSLHSFFFCIVLTFGLAILQGRIKLVSMSAHSMCASVCMCTQDCAKAQVHHMPPNAMSRGCFHLWFWYLLRAFFFFPKEFIILITANDRKVIAGVTCYQFEIAFM